MTTKNNYLLDARVILNRDSLTIDVELQLQHGEVIAVLGPNGAGKTSLLHALLGWLELESGWIMVNGEVIDSPDTDSYVPPQHRPFGMVFQDGLLFPHMSVEKNILFGAGKDFNLKPLAESLQVSELLAKFPSELSAGERQRAAIARSLAARPKVLFLDEPFSALDIQGKRRGRSLLKEALAIEVSGCLMVTHDLVDAFTLADRVMIIEGGKLTQFDVPDRIRSRPGSEWIADLVGWNYYEGIGEGSVVTLPHGTTIFTAQDDLDGPTSISINPASVSIFKSQPSGSPRNTWLSSIQNIEILGGRARVSLVGEIDICADITTVAANELRQSISSEVWVSVKATEVDTQR
ncbi:MAG: ABC transporter ATP-binding protein [Acidimicrobiaceae bacterium]|jgi:molybdate transport system ATP-binding protein|nr:ABC transporter ATP-binding protein [Acidimicrobiaceae bacterium]HCK74456.1 ABC transporter ATP-binding protein [Acidimicrobiaceae bacterium]|tara:strand:+ start:3644 stop:4690 length:1047 start_codon:yes stop_codon:yes gene_type:complete